MLITVGLIHLFFPLLLICYCLLASKVYDKYLLMLILTVPIGWIWCNNICSLSYFYCKQKNDDDADDIVDAREFMRKHVVNVDFIRKIPYFMIGFAIFFSRIFILQSVRPVLALSSFVLMLTIDISRKKYSKENKTFPPAYKVCYSILFSILIYLLMKSDYPVA